MGDISDDLIDQITFSQWDDESREEDEGGKWDPYSLPEGMCVHETERAILFRWGFREEWFPKSIIHHSSGVRKKKDTGALVVAHWFAAKEGLDK